MASYRTILFRDDSLAVEYDTGIIIFDSDTGEIFHQLSEEHGLYLKAFYIDPLFGVQLIMIAAPNQTIEPKAAIERHKLGILRKSELLTKEKIALAKHRKLKGQMYCKQCFKEEFHNHCLYQRD